MKAYIKSITLLLILVSISCKKQTTGSSGTNRNSSFSALVNSVNWPPYQNNFTTVLFNETDTLGINTNHLVIGLSSASSTGVGLEQILINAIKSPNSPILTGEEFFGYTSSDSTRFMLGAYNTTNISGDVMLSESDTNAYLRITKHDLTNKVISGEFWFESIDNDNNVYSITQGVFTDINYD